MHRRAYIYLIAATLFWGGNIVAGKFAVGHVSPMMLNLLRWTGATLILLPFGWRHLIGDWHIIRQNLGFLLLMGALAMGLFNALIYVALNFTTAINASILQTAVPMVVFAANFLVYRERLGLAQFIGLLLTIAGILFIAGEGSLVRLRSLQINLGDGLMIIAVILYGGYIVLLRRMPRIHWQSMMIVMFAGATMISMPSVLAEAGLGKVQLPDGTGLLVILYTVIFPSIAAQTLMVMGAERIGANRAGLFINLIPLFGTFMSILILFEPFFAYHAAALLLVLLGIAISERFRPAGAG